jgi:cytochrome c oxidase cbb3-type subunit 3
LNFSVRPARVALVLVAGFAAQLGAQQNPAMPKAGRPANPAPGPVTPAPRRTFGGAGGNYKTYDPALLEAGKKTFSANCAFCHGSNAKGGESGPDLLRSVVVLHDENGESIGKVILNGRPEKGMPKFSFSPEQIASVAAFLHDSVRAAANRGSYTILNIVVGDPKAGEAYFNGAGKCSGCHSATGDLAHIGSKLQPVELQQKIVMPREGRAASRAPQPEGTAITATVTLPSGEVVKGRLGRVDDFSVSLIDANGDYRSFTRDGDSPKVELHDPLEAHTELLSKYTDSDIHNLTAYLLTLK